ncbi:MAG TPA: response regulator transcription factor [Burkholderiales bacterium]|nr:response regulator transcription factor [Burkholderiales bacterium]
MKILVVDDHAMVREGVKHALESLGSEVNVIEARNAQEALRTAEQHPDLDLVLLDLGLPGTDGFAILEQLHERNAALPVIIVSASDDRSQVMTALNMGAAGFIPKSCAREVTLQAVRLVLAGGVYIPPQALGFSQSREMCDTELLARAHAVSAARPLGLTERQTEVLALLARGKPNKIIASELNIAEPTVKAHVTEILRALKVTNRAQAVIAARRIGFQ